MFSTESRGPIWFSRLAVFGLIDLESASIEHKPLTEGAKRCLSAVNTSLKAYTCNIYSFSSLFYFSTQMKDGIKLVFVQGRVTFCY